MKWLSLRQAAQGAEASAVVLAPKAPVRPRLRGRAVVAGGALALVAVLLVLQVWHRGQVLVHQGRE